MFDLPKTMQCRIRFKLSIFLVHTIYGVFKQVNATLHIIGITAIHRFPHILDIQSLKVLMKKLSFLAKIGRPIAVSHFKVAIDVES